MRIFAKTLTGENFPLEVESYDTIYYVKGLLRVIEGTRESEIRLILDKEKFLHLEDSRTLADYGIRNDSTILLMHAMGGGMHVFIKTFPQKPFSLLVTGLDTIDVVKSRIEWKMGIPVNGQRLFFSGKELHDGGRILEEYGIGYAATLRLVRIRGYGDDVVDIAALQARRRAAFSKGKGTGNGAEVGSKRAREDSSSAVSETGMSSCGANRVEGVESFWDEQDFGFESKTRRTLVESVANDRVRTPAFLESQLQKYQDKLSRAEDEVKRLTNDMDEVKRQMQELIVERSTGASFFQSEAWRRHIVSMQRKAVRAGVKEFKEGALFKEIVTNRAMSVYDDVVKECQRLLRKSGRVSEDIIQLIDVVDSDHDEGEKADTKKLMQELDVERSTGSFFLQSEVGRRHIVSLQRKAAMSGVEEFKKSAALEEMVMNRAMSIYDDVVKECQRLLRQSGCVSEDIIQLLDHPRDDDDDVDDDDLL